MIDRLVETLKSAEAEAEPLSRAADARILSALRRAHAPSAFTLHVAAAAVAALALALSIRAFGHEPRAHQASALDAARDFGLDASIAAEAGPAIDPFTPGGPRHLP